MVHVFIVGSKGIPAKYGGFETFVENLTSRKKDKNIFYHISCMDNEEKHFEYNGADCFNVKIPLGGAKGRILHVFRVLLKVEGWKKRNRESRTVVYILGCRIGPFLIPHARIMHKMGIKILVNPDGLEWKRDKWNKLAKRFLKYCEKCLVCNADLIICDSAIIRKYIQDAYPEIKEKTRHIAYGATVEPSRCSDSIVDNWLSENQVKKNNYYLIVGRFVPENNYETMILEYMKSNTKKPLVIISNVEKDRFYYELLRRTHFDKDERIRFVGTVYETELLKRIREYAFAYIHGHEVGGTNPSLLEALASTEINLLLDVGFNREVAEDGAIYWKKENGNLCELINRTDNMKISEIKDLGCRAKRCIRDKFLWDKIVAQCEDCFNTVVL